MGKENSLNTASSRVEHVVEVTAKRRLIPSRRSRRYSILKNIDFNAAARHLSGCQRYLDKLQTISCWYKRIATKNNTKRKTKKATWGGVGESRDPAGTKNLYTKYVLGGEEWTEMRVYTEDVVRTRQSLEAGLCSQRRSGEGRGWRRACPHTCGGTTFFTWRQQ